MPQETSETEGRNVWALLAKAATFGGLCEEAWCGRAPAVMSLAGSTWLRSLCSDVTQDLANLYLVCIRAACDRK